MNKSELIKRLKEQGTNNQVDDYSEGFDDAIVFALELAVRLDEPETLSEKWIFDNQEMYIVNDTSENAVNVWRLKNLIVPEPEKPVVPRFVADWFEENKDNFEQNIYGLIVDLNRRGVSPRNEFEHWFMHNQDKPTETLVKMKLYGYEVEKEPQWVVRHDGRIKGSYFRGFNGLDGAPFNSIIGASLESAYKFDSEEKAEAVALLIDGEVEEVEE